MTIPRVGKWNNPCGALSVGLDMWLAKVRKVRRFPMKPQSQLPHYPIASSLLMLSEVDTVLDSSANADMESVVFHCKNPTWPNNNTKHDYKHYKPLPKTHYESTETTCKNCPVQRCPNVCNSVSCDLTTSQTWKLFEKLSLEIPAIR